MEKYTTVFFKDKDKNFYIGKQVNGKIVGFNSINLKVDLKDISTFNNLQLNEFLIVEVESRVDSFKLTPLTQGSLSADATSASLCDLTHDKLMEVFNTLVKLEGNGAPSVDNHQ